MATVQKINKNTTYKKTLLTPRNTGYVATGALLITTMRAFSKNKTITKTHKTFGYITAALTLLHIGIVEYLHHKYKKM